MLRGRVGLLLALLTVAAKAQAAPAATPSRPRRTHRRRRSSRRRTPPVLPAVASQAPLDVLAALVKDGRLRIEADLHAGSVPAIPKYALEVQGSPKTTVEAEAADGSVTKMKFVVENGKLVVRGSGLRPQGLDRGARLPGAPQGVTAMKFHGLGIWKPIVAIFGGIARSAVRKMEFRTDLPSVLKGEVLGGKEGDAVRRARPVSGARTRARSRRAAGRAPPPRRRR